jgi:hypothetical protein
VGHHLLSQLEVHILGKQEGVVAPQCMVHPRSSALRRLLICMILEEYEATKTLMLLKTK